MSHYTARIEVADGMLHTSRPLTAPEVVTDLVDSLVYAVRNESGGITAVELEIDTPEESGTPIADGVTGTTSAPLDDDEDGQHAAAPATAPLLSPGGQS